MSALPGDANMAGEYALAHTLLQQAFAEAEQNPSMSQEALGNALLNTLADHLRRYRSHEDILGALQYHLENSDNEFNVITRGC